MPMMNFDLLTRSAMNGKEKAAYCSELFAATQCVFKVDGFDQLVFVPNFRLAIKALRIIEYDWFDGYSMYEMFVDGSFYIDEAGRPCFSLNLPDAAEKVFEYTLATCAFVATADLIMQGPTL